MLNWRYVIFNKRENDNLKEIKAIREMFQKLMPLTDKTSIKVQIPTGKIQHIFGHWKLPRKDIKEKITNLPSKGALV